MARRRGSGTDLLQLVAVAAAVVVGVSRERLQPRVVGLVHGARGQQRGVEPEVRPRREQVLQHLVHACATATTSTLVTHLFVQLGRSDHTLSINRPTKRGKEKSSSDKHCQCEKEVDDHLLACQ
jgi:hypothetical protein